VRAMPLQQDARSGPKSARRMHLDAPALVTCLVAALASVGCIVIGALHAYKFVVLMLDRGHIPARNAELFAACAWLAGALVLALGAGLLVRLMYRVNASVAEPSDAPDERTERHTDGSGRRR
jgi:hypothetical protein